MRRVWKSLAVLAVAVALSGCASEDVNGNVEIRLATGELVGTISHGGMGLKNSCPGAETKNLRDYEKLLAINIGFKLEDTEAIRKAYPQGISISAENFSLLREDGTYVKAGVGTDQKCFMGKAINGYIFPGETIEGRLLMRSDGTEDEINFRIQDLGEYSWDINWEEVK